MQSSKAHERNNYSGLNALRKRLANKDWDGISDTTTERFWMMPGHLA